MWIMMFLNFFSICHFIRNTFMVVPTSNLMLQQVHVFIMFSKEIHVGNYGSWICYIFSYGGRKVSAYFVGLTICFLIKHNKNPDTDGSNSSLC